MRFETMAILTKNEIINGKKVIKEFNFKTLGGSLKLRPLTDGDYHKVHAIVQGGGIGSINTKPVMKNGEMDKDATLSSLDFDIDIMEADNAKFKADCQAIVYSLTHDESEDVWTVEDVGKFPAGSVNEIAMKVYEISGVADPNTTRKNVEDFRNKE
jgi:hypothetical protein